MTIVQETDDDLIYIGDCFSVGVRGNPHSPDMYPYMFCNVSQDKVALISLTSGNRWDEPMEVVFKKNRHNDRYGITMSDFGRMRGTTRFTRIPRPSELRKYNNREVEE